MNFSLPSFLYFLISLCMLSQSLRRFSVMSSNGVNFFKNNQLFAVVGASEDRDKFGNKVLRCYKHHGFRVIPINKKTKIIEEITTIPTLTTLLTSTDVAASSIGVSIVTPPKITEEIINEGIQLGIKNFFLQPGSYTPDLIKRVGKDVNIIEGCVLVALGFDE